MENSSKIKLSTRIIIAVSVIVALLVLDIVTKLVVYNAFNGIEGSNVVVIKDFFWIHLTFNRGALASFLADVEWGIYLLSAFSIAGSIASIWYLVKNINDLHPLIRCALYLFIPGCTGNLIDRVGLYNTPGVIDFLRFRLFGFYEFPIFNVADICLTLSIVIFFIWAFFFDKEKDDELEAKLNEGIEE